MPFLSFDLQTSQKTEEVSSYVPVAAYALLTIVSGWRLWVHRARGCSFAAWTSAKFAFHGYLFAFAVFRTVANALQLMPDFSGLPALIFNSISGCSYISLLLFLEMHWRDLLRPLAAVRRDRQAYLLSYAAFAFANLGLYAFIGVCVWLEWTERSAQEMEGSSSPPPLYWSQGVIDGLLILIAISYTSTAVRMWLRVGATLKAAGKSASKASVMEGSTGSDEESYSELYHSLLPSHADTASAKGTKSVQQGTTTTASASASASSRAVLASLQAFIGIMLSSACLLCVRAAVSLSTSGAVQGQWWWQLAVTWLPDVPPCLAYMVLMWPRDGDKTLVEGSRSRLGQLFRQLVVLGEPALGAYSGPGSHVSLQTAYGANTLHLAGNSGPMSPLTLSIRTPGRSTGGVGTPLLQHDHLSHSNTAGLGMLLPESAAGSQAAHERLQAAASTTVVHCTEVAPLPAAAAISIIAAPLLSLSFAHVLLPSRPALVREQAVAASSRPSPPNLAPTAPGASSTYPPGGRGPVPAAPGRGMGPRRHTVRHVGAGLRLASHDDDNQHQMAQQDRAADSPQSTPRLVALRSSSIGEYEPSNDRPTRLPASPTPAAGPAATPMSAQSVPLQPVRTPGPMGATAGIRSGWYTGGAGARAGALPASAGGSTQAPSSAVSGWSRAEVGATPSYSRFAVHSSFTSPQPSGGRPGASGPARIGQTQHPILLSLPPALVHARLSELRTWLGWECYAVVQVGVAPLPPQTQGSAYDSSTSPTLLPYRLPQSVVGLAQAHARAQGVGIATGQSWLQSWQSVCDAQAASPSEAQPSSPSLWRYLGHSEPSFLQEEDEGGASSGGRGDIDVGYGGSNVSSGVWLSANTDEEHAGSALRSGPSMSPTTLVGQPCISTRASFGLGLLCPLPALVEAWEGARAINRALDAQSFKANAGTGEESSDDSAPPSPFAASTESEHSPQATAPVEQPPSIAPQPGHARYGAFLRVSLRWYDSADEEGQGSVGSGIGGDSVVGNGEEEITGVRTWGMVQANSSLGNLAHAPTSPTRVRGGSGSGRVAGQDGTQARATTAAGASTLLGYTGHADSGQEYSIGNWDLPISALLPLLLSRVDSGAPGAGAVASEIIIQQSDAPQHVAQAPLPPGPSTMSSTVGSTGSGAATLGNAVMIINGSGLSAAGQGMSLRAGGGFASPMYSLAGPNAALSTIGEGTHSYSRPGLLRLCCEPLTSVRPGLDLLLPPPWAWPQRSEGGKGKEGSKSKVKALALDDDDDDNDRTPNDLFDEDDDDDGDDDDAPGQENARAGTEDAEDESSGAQRTHADATSSDTEIEAQTVDDSDLADDESSKDRQKVGQVAVRMQAASGAGSGSVEASDTQRMGHQNSGRRMKRVGTAVVLAKKLAEAGQRYLQLGPSAGGDAAVAGDGQSVAQSASSAVAQPDVRKRNDKSGVVKHGKEREVAPLGLAHDGYGRAGIKRLPHSSRRLDNAVYGYTLSLRAVLPSGGSAGPQAVLPASPAPSMPLLPGSAGSKASTAFTSPVGVARSVPGGGTPASAFARTAGMNSTALLPLPLPPASAYGRLLPRLYASSGAPLELRISAVECTIESHASVSVPRALLPLVLASRTAQLGRARAMLERYLFAMRKGRGNESTRQSQGNGSELRHSGLSGIYSRLVSHIEREEEAVAGARWLTHRLVRLQAGVGDLQAVLREVCGFHCAATLGPGMARGRSRSALVVPAAGRSASFISGQPQLQALASAGILDAGRTLLHAQLLSAPVPRPIAPASRKGSAPGIGPVRRGKAGSRAWSTESIQGATTDVPPVSTFRPSTRKKDSTARYMAVNLHAQMMTMQSTLAQVWEPGKQERATGQEGEGARPAYPVATATVRMVTVGAPCSHWHGFRGAQGLGFGLARLLASQGPPAATLDGQTNFAAPHKLLRELAQNQRLRECEDARLALRARAEACYSQALSGLTASFTQSLQAALDQCSTTTASAWLSHMQIEASKAPAGAVPSVQRAAISGWLRLQQETSCDGYRALRQWLAVGWPAVWQSLLSAVGKERGMLDDARVCIAACSLLRFALVDADEAGMLSSDADRAAAQGAGADEWLGAEHGGTGLPASACAEPAAGPVPRYAWQTGNSVEGEKADGRGLQAYDCSSVVPLQVLSHAVQALPAWLWSQLEASMGSVGGIMGSNGEGTPEGLVLVIPVTGLRAACVAGVVPPDLLPHGAGSMSTHSPYPTMAACPAFLSCGINEQAQVASLLGTHGLQADVNACSVRALWAYVRAWVAHVTSENARLRRQAESVQQLLAVGRQAGADSAPFASNDSFATHAGLGSALTRGHGDHLGRLWVETCANIDEAASQRSSGLGGFAGTGASFREMSASFLSRGGKDGDPKKLRSMASAGPKARAGQSFGHPVSAHKSPGGHMIHSGNRNGSSTTSTPVPAAWAKRAPAPDGTGPVMTGASASRLFDWLWLPTPPVAAVDDGAEDGTSTPWTSSQPYLSAPGWSGGVVPGAAAILPETLANDHGLPAGVRWIAASKAACSTLHMRQHGHTDATKQDSTAAASLLLHAPPALVSCLPTATDTTAAAGVGSSWAIGVGEDAYSDSLGDAPRARLAISLLLQLRAALMEGYGDERDGMGDLAEAEARGGYSYGQSHATTTTGVYAAASGADMAPFPELEGGIGLFEGDAGQVHGGAAGESASATALRLADDLCFLMRGGKIVSCKSAKDRTGMEATLSQARRLAAFEAGCLASVATALSTAPALATAHLAWLQNKDASNSDVSLPFQQRWLLCAPAHDLSRRWATCLSRIRSVWPVGHGAAAALPELVSALVPVSLSLPAGVLAAGDCLADSARAHLHSQHDTSSDTEAAHLASLAAVSSLGGTTGGLAVGIEGTEDACLADPIGTASFLREYGTRLACCAKNTGSYRYAFSGLQRAFFPPEYRAPNSTIGGSLT